MAIAGTILVGYGDKAKADAPAPSTQPKFIIDSCANNGILILWVFDVENDKILMYNTNAQGKDFNLHAIRTIKADLTKPDFGDGK